MHRGALREPRIGGKRKHSPSFAKSLLRIRATKTARRINPRSGRHAVDTLADRKNRSRTVNALAYREVPACADRYRRACKRRRVYARRFNLYDDLTRSRLRIWDLFELQLFRTAKFLHANCFHSKSPFLRAGAIYIVRTARNRALPSTTRW